MIFKEFVTKLKNEIGDIDFTVDFAGLHDGDPVLDSKNPTEESMRSYRIMLKQWGAESVEVSYRGKLMEGCSLLNPNEKVEQAMKLINDWLLNKFFGSI